MLGPSFDNYVFFCYSAFEFLKSINANYIWLTMAAAATVWVRGAF